MSDFTEFVAAIERKTGVPGKRVGKNTRLLCPAHDDHSPSLDVAEGDNGTPLCQCRSNGCTFAAIAAAIGWEPSRNGAPDEVWTPAGPAVAVYDYVDEANRLLFQVCRTASKQFMQRIPDPSQKSGWRWKLGETRRVLYHLPAVCEAATIHERVYVCEGEKDVHAVEDRGGIATCNPMGAGKWRDEYSLALVGTEVVVVADRDEAGLEHARSVLASLEKHGIVSRVALPAEGNDVSDHLAAGLLLEALIPMDETDAPDPVFVDAYAFASAQLEKPAPLWGSPDVSILAAGGLAILAGRPGTGKTTFILDLACHLAAGKPYPPVDLNGPGSPPTPWGVPRPLRIALIENEGPEQMFQAKLGEKLNRFPHDINTGGGKLLVQTWRWGSFSFADEDALERSSSELDEHEIDLVIGDPLLMLGVVGVGSPADTREFVQILHRLGLGQHRAFLFLHHFREKTERNEDELARISGAWGGHLDTLLTLSAMGKADQARLAFPKIRWSTVAPPKPVVLGRVFATATFEALSEEGDLTLLEPEIAGWLSDLKLNGGGRGGEGWSTQTEIQQGVERRRHDVAKTLEGAPHIFARAPVELLRTLRVKHNAKLWGLAAWIQKGAYDEPDTLLTEPNFDPQEDIPF